ncbi:MAG: PDDEXK nuclease domain-containing protein [Oscillospiraceae bacterium]|nr:PDDEXK nuclease domain-containing protein [Oscillospiraceae bacterium]
MSDELAQKWYKEFNELLTIYENAKVKVDYTVNYIIIDMYWDIGKYISEKIKNNSWGKSIVKEFSNFMQKHHAGINGFSPQNIWRMKQFYETYKENEKLSAVLREISWTNNLTIMSRSKTDEEREFYLTLTAKNKYSTRELERQIKVLMFERKEISDIVNKPHLSKGKGLKALRDNYTLEFIDLPKKYKERDLQKAIVLNLKDFILEFGKNFAFVGENYRVQVGNTDFFIDLLFFNRELQCLVAIELKVDKFEPEHMGQIEFYLEALDSDVKLPHENPSVGLILCTAKDDTVVEYALRRSMSPTLIADYQLHLPDKKILEDKLRELQNIVDMQDSEALLLEGGIDDEIE